VTAAHDRLAGREFYEQVLDQGTEDVLLPYSTLPNQPPRLRNSLLLYSEFIMTSHSEFGEMTDGKEVASAFAKEIKQKTSMHAGSLYSASFQLSGMPLKN
jgi:hypothetical protein